MQIHNMIVISSLDSQNNETKAKLLNHRTGSKKLNRLTIDAIIKSDHLDSEGNVKVV